MNDLPIYIDIDGTLTTEAEKQWGPPRDSRIKQVQKLIAAGEHVVIWSGGGTAYARAFVKQYGLDGAIAIGKPIKLVDDNPMIRPEIRMQWQSPFVFFGDA